MTFWEGKRVMVTGGAGFLGSYVVEKLQEHGCQEVFVPRSKDYDLRDNYAVIRAYEDSHPHIVIHLAALVGGIGANRERPGEFFYDNLIMGAQVMEQARLFGVEKFVSIGLYALIPNSLLCLLERRISGMATQKRPMRPMGWRRKCCWCRGASLPEAIWI